MTTRFTLPWANTDLDIHPDPSEGWCRVAILGGWEDAAKTRQRWPHAAAVGPLRTLRGIDLLVRALLANPQIRALVWDGPDLTPGEMTRSALFDLFARDSVESLHAWSQQHGIPVDALVDLLEPNNGGVSLVENGDTEWIEQSAHLEELTDRLGGKIILPPPTPAPTARAPHGDPADRIAGTTLADVWPRLLDRILTCGREASTHYGMTRELLDATVVVRLPGSSIRPLLLGNEGETGWAALGGMTKADLDAYYNRLTTPEKAEGAAYSYGSLLRGEPESPVLGCTTRAEIMESLRLQAKGPYDGETVEALSAMLLPDQLADLDASIQANPSYRGHYVTPWHPTRFAAHDAKGKPCLVGAWFRATGDETLHLTTIWRSRDCFGAWPLNAAACCQWLVTMAAKHGMAAGTYTDISLSAHVYERDYAAAQEIVDAYKPPPGPRWDQRSSWRITRDQKNLRAEALSPDGKDVLAVYEAHTPKTLLRRVAESGLVQSIEAAMWLGGEIERVWRSR